MAPMEAADSAASSGGNGGSALAPAEASLYFCHLCSFAGVSHEAFRSHMATHYEYQCPACDYKSRTDGRLKRHLKDFHSEVPPDSYSGKAAPSRQKLHRCRQCSFVAEDKVAFWQHSKGHIKREKLLECPSCPFVTEYKHHLEYHIRNHLGSKPFKCPKCNYQCVNRSMLNSHLKSHTNVYQYRCLHCSYATKYCHSLKQHLRKFGHRPAAILNADGSLPKPGARQHPMHQQQNTVAQPPAQLPGLCSPLSFLNALQQQQPRPQPALPPPPLPPPPPPPLLPPHLLIPLDLTAKAAPGLHHPHQQHHQQHHQHTHQQQQQQPRCECQYCGIAFKEPQMFDLHMGYHGYENPFKCNRCGWEARDELDFFIHLVSSAHC